MGHPGNWSERKLRSVQLANIRADRERLRTSTIEEHAPRGSKLAETHPCFAYRMRWQVYATCMGCLSRRFVDLGPLQYGRFAHAPFPQLMSVLTCSKCGSCAGSLHFERMEGARRLDLGCLVARPADSP